MDIKKLTNDIHVGRRHRQDPSQLFMLDGNESSRTCLNKSTVEKLSEFFFVFVTVFSLKLHKEAPHY